jgi:hypothetical protein
VWTHAASTGTLWFWSITARVPQSSIDRGYATKREQAMADFKAAWKAANWGMLRREYYRHQHSGGN